MAKSKDKPKQEKIVIAEIPFYRETVRLEFDPTDLTDVIRKKYFETTGHRMSKNEIFRTAVIKYAIALIGEDEVQKCLKKK